MLSVRILPPERAPNFDIFQSCSKVWQTIPEKLRNQILSILVEDLGQSDQWLTSYGEISEKIGKSIFGKMHLAYLFFLKPQ